MRAPPLQPKGLAAVVWPRALMASRARSGILAPRVLCDRGVFDKMEDLVKKVGDFAKDLADDITGFIDSLPSVGSLMEMAEDFVKDKILSEDGLCIAPYCPGIHINSGVEENLANKLFKEEELEILASHHITRAYRPHTNVAQMLPFPTLSWPLS